MMKTTVVMASNKFNTAGIQHLITYCYKSRKSGDSIITTGIQQFLVNNNKHQQLLQQLRFPSRYYYTQRPQHQRKLSLLTQQQQQQHSVLSRSLLVIDEEVQEAIANHRPVVALESTIIAHGMPFPENVQLAQRISNIVRQKGAIPATIAIKNGTCHVGLSTDDIEDLARSGMKQEVMKCSTRELSLLLSRHKHHQQQQQQQHQQQEQDPSRSNQWGATTVAATMRLAHLAGISTFVTGGIGGVHRHGHDTMDVSADLMELSRTPVIVVSAGIKSILDIQRTLEVLETYGVPVVSYQCDEFPAFFSPRSGIQAPERIDDVQQIASAYMIAQDLGLSHDFLIGVPNTDPAGANVEEAIQAALIEAKDIAGRDVTPFILKYVSSATQGDSLRSNMALVEHNATVGADIAVAMAQLKRSKMRQQQQQSRQLQSSTAVPKSRVIVMGGIVLDVIARPIEGQLLTLGTSNPAICIESDGGVGRNIAETLSRLGSKPLLYSAIGNDTRGNSMLRRLQDDCGIMSLEHTVHTVPTANTATYIAMLNEHRDLHAACADMEVLNHVTPPPLAVLQHAEYLVVDANPPINVLLQTVQQAVNAGVKVFFDPTSVPKVKKLCADDHFLSFITFASPNLDELYAMTDYIATTFSTSTDNLDDDFVHSTSTDNLDDDFVQSTIYPVAANVIKRMHPNTAYLIVTYTCGAYGVILATKVNGSDVTFQRFRVPNHVVVKNATGAGDTLSGAFVHALLNGKTIPDAIAFGMDAATVSLQCTDRAISPSLTLSF